MKKSTGIIITLCVVVAVLAVVIAFMVGKKSSNQVTTTATPTVSQTVATKAAATTVAENNEDVSDSDIKVIKKYNYLDDDDYKMVVVLKNTGKGNAAVSVVGKIYDGANDVAGTERESVFLDPGAKTVVDLDFDTEGVKVKNEDYKITVAKATAIKPGISKINYKAKTTGNIVTLTSKNTADYDLQGVEANILFFNGNDLVDIESEDVGDDNTEIFAKGTTSTQRFDTHENFNKIKVFYSQTQDKPDSDDDDGDDD